MIILLVAAIVYLRARPEERHPREIDFVNCFVDLALLSAESDSGSAQFLVERDSVLQVYGFTDSTLLQLKEELNRQPERLIEIWDKIEARVKERRIAMGQKIDDARE